MSRQREVENENNMLLNKLVSIMKRKNQSVMGARKSLKQQYPSNISNCFFDQKEKSLQEYMSNNNLIGSRRSFMMKPVKI